MDINCGRCLLCEMKFLNMPVLTGYMCEALYETLVNVCSTLTSYVKKKLTWVVFLIIFIFKCLITDMQSAVIIIYLFSITDLLKE